MTFSLASSWIGDSADASSTQALSVLSQVQFVPITIAFLLCWAWNFEIQISSFLSKSVLVLVLCANILYSYVETLNLGWYSYSSVYITDNYDQWRNCSLFEVASKSDFTCGFSSPRSIRDSYFLRWCTFAYKCYFNVIQALEELRLFSREKDVFLPLVNHHRNRLSFRVVRKKNLSFLHIIA